MPTKPDALEKRVLVALRWLDRRWTKTDPSDRECTAALMQVLERLGKDLGYHVNRRAPITVRNGEWLFDMIWTSYRKDLLVDVPLVLECEWTPAKLNDDFDKLLVARARHRVFVFYGYTRQSVDTALKSFVHRIQRSRLTEPRDRYLFAAWTDERPYLSTWLQIGRRLTSA